MNNSSNNFISEEMCTVMIYARNIVFFKWEDTIKSITQVYLQQIRIKKKYK